MSAFHAFCTAFFFLYGLQRVSVFPGLHVAVFQMCLTLLAYLLACLLGNNLMLYMGKVSLISPHSEAETKRDMQMVSGYMYITPDNKLLQNHCWTHIQVLTSQQASNVDTCEWYDCKTNTLLEVPRWLFPIKLTLFLRVHYEML